MGRRLPIACLALLACAYFANQHAIGAQPVGPGDLIDQLAALGYDATGARVLEASSTQQAIGLSSRLTFREAGQEARTVQLRAVRPFAFTGWQIRELQAQQP